VLEVAVAGNAEMIITNNGRDFRNTQQTFPQIEIVTPNQILRGH